LVLRLEFETGGFKYKEIAALAPGVIDGQALVTVRH
jgi:hypothetical protein